MGRELAAAFVTARDVFDEIDEALKQNLSRLMFEGPEDELVLTENAQPALMAVSLAVARVLERDGGLDLKRHIAFVAGHSLGEYSALAAAHALGLADAARLLKRRGLAMQRAVPVGVGAMAALLGMEIEAAREVAKAAAQGEVCDTANDNGPGQVVVSGHKTAVERAIAIAAERGARRSILLPVSAPFHCALMQPAADEMAEALAEVKLVEPLMPLVANVSAAPGSRARRHQAAPRRAGHGAGALARMRPDDEARRRARIDRARCRPCAERPRQAHRPRAHCVVGRHAGRGRGISEDDLTANRDPRDQRCSI